MTIKNVEQQFQLNEQMNLSDLHVSVNLKKKEFKNSLNKCVLAKEH